MREKAISTTGARSATPPARSLLVLGLYLLVGVLYAILFLRQPLIEGSAANDNQALSRGAFVLSLLVYPEALMSSWTDSGRLPTQFSDRLPIAVATALWLALAVLVGWPWARLACQPLTLSKADGHDGRVSLTHRLQIVAWSLLIGLAWLSTVTLLVGLAGGLAVTSPVHIPLRAPLAISCASLALASFVLGRWLNARWPGAQAPVDMSVSSTRSSTDNREDDPWLTQTEPQPIGLLDRSLSMVASLLTLGLAAVVMLGAWVPSAEFDVMEYHLQAPSEFFGMGKITFMPHNIYANMPLGSEMHSLAAMTLVGSSDTWWSGLIGKSIIASLSLIGALLLGSTLASPAGQPANAFRGWCAAGIWLASPGIAHVAMLGLIDGALATYVLATVIATLRARHMLHAADPSAGLWWLIAGTMAGAAAACKYPGLIFATLPCLAYFVYVHGWPVHDRPAQEASLQEASLQEVSLRLSWRRAIRNALLLAVGLSTTWLPWFVKNAVLAGNPVYPLAASVLGGRTLTPEKIAQWQNAHRVPGGWIDAVPNFVSDAQRLLLASPFVQPTMVVGAILAAVIIWSTRAGRRSDGAVWCLWAAWMLAVWWFATHRIDRFWLPVTGLAAGLSAVGLCWLRQRWNWLAQTTLVLGLGYAAIVNSSSLVSDNRYFVSLTALRDDVGDETQVGRISKHMAWIHQQLKGPDTKILMVGEAAVFEYRVPLLYSTCFDLNAGEIWLRERSLAEQCDALRQNGISHLMINWREIERYRSPGNYGFSQWPTRADIDQLIASGLVKRVDWPIPIDSVELLQVVP